MTLRFFFLPKVSGSRIKSGVSLLDRFWVGDAVRARFNLVGGGFHRVLQRPVCCGKDYSGRSTHKTRLGAADHVWLGSSKIAVATVRLTVLLTASSEGNHGINRQCARDSLCFFFAAVFLTNTLRYGSWFCLVAGSSATSEKAGDDEAKRCCLWLSRRVTSFYRARHKHTHTHGRAYAHRGTVTHSQEYTLPLVETGRHPRCITLPPLVHFKDLSSTPDESTSPGWLICTRLAVLADSGCHVDSISDVTQWSLKRDMIGMETSHTKGRWTKMGEGIGEEGE